MNPENIVVLTALVLLLSGLGCRLAAWYWSNPLMKSISEWLLGGGFAVACLPLVFALIYIGGEKIVKFAKGRMK